MMMEFSISVFSKYITMLHHQNFFFFWAGMWKGLIQLNFYIKK